MRRSISTTLVAVCLAAVSMGTCAQGEIRWSTAYQGASMSDGFSAIHYAGNGVALAGRRSSTASERIFRSTANGEAGSWKSVGAIGGYSGAHTYWFGSHGDTVLTSTGDVGKPCILRSGDRGATWSVVLSAAQASSLAGSDPGAIFSPLWVPGSSRWLACMRSTRAGRHLIESRDDGRTWALANSTGLSAGARKMILTTDQHAILYGGTFSDAGAGGSPGLFISRDHGFSWERKLAGEMVFSGLEDCGRGVWLCGTVNGVKSPIMTSTRARTNGLAVVTTALPHGLANGTHVALYGFTDPSFDLRPDGPVAVTGINTLVYPSPGPDVRTAIDTHGRVNLGNPLKLFRSTDYGNTWSLAAVMPVFSSLAYIRSIQHVGDGVVWAHACGSEDSWGDRALRFYRSADYGATWKVVDNFFSGPYGPLNAIYETALVPGGAIIAATQPDAAILYSKL